MPGRLMPMKLATSTAKNRMLQGRGIGRGGGGGGGGGGGPPVSSHSCTDRPHDCGHRDEQGMGVELWREGKVGGGDKESHLKIQITMPHASWKL